MVKVKSTLTVYSKSLFNHDYNWFNSNLNRSGYSDYTYTENFSGNGEITFSGQFRDNGNGGTPTSITYSGNITEVSKNLDNYHSYSTTVKINGTGSVSVKGTKYNSYSRASGTTSSATYRFQVPGTSSNENRGPNRILGLLGEIGSYTSLGRHIDGSWITGS